MSTLAIVPDSSSPGRATFSDRVMGLMARVDYRRADTVDDREAIFRLRYQAYLREGAIVPRADERFSDPFDEAPNASIFGVYIDGRLASSIRLHVTSQDCTELPALTVFSDYIEPELSRNKVIVDPTRFVTNLEASRAFPELPYVTVRLAWLAAKYFDADHLLATVRAEHRAFYQRVFGHRAICEPRVYPTLTKKISLMSVDYEAVKDSLYRRYPFFRSNFFERRMLFAQHTPQPAQIMRPIAA